MQKTSCSLDAVEVAYTLGHPSNYSCALLKRHLLTRLCDKKKKHLIIKVNENRQTEKRL